MAASLERIARARAKAQAHVRQLIEGTAAGFPWLAIAGKTLTGWLVIDMDATLVTARRGRPFAFRPTLGSCTSAIDTCEQTGQEQSFCGWPPQSRRGAPRCESAEE